MPTTLLSLRFPRFDPAPAAMVIVASLIASQSAAGAASPFEKFVGVWRGAGEIVVTNGHREVDPLPSPIHGGERRFGSERVDCVRERKLQA